MLAFLMLCSVLLTAAARDVDLLCFLTTMIVWFPLDAAAFAFEHVLFR